MGLDQWAYARKGSPQKKTSEYEYFDHEGGKCTTPEVMISWKCQTSLCCARKHPRVRSCMKTRWRDSGAEG